MLEGRFEWQDCERNKEELEEIGWVHEWEEKEESHVSV